MHEGNPHVLTQTRGYKGTLFLLLLLLVLLVVVVLLANTRPAGEFPSSRRQLAHAILFRWKI